MLDDTVLAPKWASSISEKRATAMRRGNLLARACGYKNFNNCKPGLGKGDEQRPWGRVKSRLFTLGWTAGTLKTKNPRGVHFKRSIQTGMAEKRGKSPRS